jgi:hypothetical protein
VETLLSDTTPRLTPRSAVATADFELLRVARTEFDDGDAPVSLSLTERLRGLALFRVARGDEGGTIVRLGRTED